MMTDTTTFNRRDFRCICFHLLVSFDLVTNRSNPKSNTEDLNYALKHNQKLENLPDIRFGISRCCLQTLLME